MRYDKNNERDVEKLFDYKTEFDKKSKLLLSNKRIPESFVKAIEDGDITSEILSTLDFPIRKYYTQITVHGVFPELDKIGYRYKFVFKNKNGSVGIKWQAIDRKKRDYIARYLKHSGIHYFSNSSESYFIKSRMVTEENYQEVLDDMKDLLEKSKQSEYYGGSNIYKSNVYGTPFLVFQMVVNGITETNVEKLLNAFGYSKEDRKRIDAERLAKEEADKKAWVEKWAKQKADKDVLKHELLEELKENGYSKEDVETFEDEALLFQAKINWSDEKEFILMKRYKETPRSRCFKIAEQKFATYAEMIEWSKENSVETSYRDRKLKQGFTSKGFRIK